METVYKLTRPDRTAHNGFKYEVGKEYRFSGIGELCGSGFSHAYLSLATAVLHNPIHGKFNPVIGWKCNAVIGKRDGHMKVGCTSIELIEQVILPIVTPEQRIAYEIHCIFPSVLPEWNKWAKDWLSGKNRSKETAWVAEAVAWAAWATAKNCDDLLSIADWAITATDPFQWEGM